MVRKKANERVERNTHPIPNKSARIHKWLGDLSLIQSEFAQADSLVSGKVTEKRDLGVDPVAGNTTGGSQLVAPEFYPILTAAQQVYGDLLTSSISAPLKRTRV
jgi:hypothetical protein